jgi:hypothetical protein
MQALAMIQPLLVAAVVSAGLGAALCPGVAAQDAPFSVERLVVSTDVQDREPVGISDVFPAGTETVFCFLEARDIRQPVKVQMVWYFGDEELARVPLALGASARWRTYASKQVGGRQGNWKVYLQDESDQILGTVQFVVE